MKKVTWNADSQAAFETLKSALMKPPILAFPSPSKPYYLLTDGSSKGVSGILAQRGDDGHLHPIAFASRSTSDSEAKYSSADLEMLAVFFALTKFRTYVYGKEIHLLTDSIDVYWFLTKANEPPSNMQARWKMKILDFHLKTVNHLPGSTNLGPDCLSRYPVAPLPGEIKNNAVFAGSIQLSEQSHHEGPELSEEGTCSEEWKERIRDHQRKDKWCQSVLNFLSRGKIPLDATLVKWLDKWKSHLHVLDGILFFAEEKGDPRLRIYVPKDVREKLLWESHGAPWGGHLGKAKILPNLESKYYWPSLRQDLEYYLTGCKRCATRSGQGLHFLPPLHPIPPPREPFEKMAMDIMKLTPTLTGMKYVLSLTDLLSGFILAAPMPDQSAETVARTWLDLCLPFGLPSQMISDRGTQFTSSLMKSICDLLQVEQLHTTTWHPQGDPDERSNRTLLAMLSKLCSKRGDDWDKLLSLVCMAYNQSTHHRTGLNPFYLVFGREPTAPSSQEFSLPAQYYNADLDDFQHEFPRYLHLAWELAREQSLLAKEKQKKQYDKRSKPCPYKVGEMVMVDNRALKKHKLSRHYIGPGRIVDLSDTNALIEFFRNGKWVVDKAYHLDKLTKASSALGIHPYLGDGRYREKLPPLPDTDKKTQIKWRGQKNSSDQAKDENSPSSSKSLEEELGDLSEAEPSSPLPLPTQPSLTSSKTKDSDESNDVTHSKNRLRKVRRRKRKKKSVPWKNDSSLLQDQSAEEHPPPSDQQRDNKTRYSLRPNPKRKVYSMEHQHVETDTVARRLIVDFDGRAQVTSPPSNHSSFCLVENQDDMSIYAPETWVCHILTNDDTQQRIPMWQNSLSGEQTLVKPDGVEPPPSEALGGGESLGSGENSEGGLAAPRKRNRDQEYYQLIMQQDMVWKRDEFLPYREEQKEGILIDLPAGLRHEDAEWFKKVPQPIQAALADNPFLATEINFERSKPDNELSSVPEAHSILHFHRGYDPHNSPYYDVPRNTAELMVSIKRLQDSSPDLGHGFRFFGLDTEHVPAVPHTVTQKWTVRNQLRVKSDFV